MKNLLDCQYICLHICIGSFLQSNPADISYSSKPGMSNESMNILEMC